MNNKGHNTISVRRSCNEVWRTLWNVLGENLFYDIFQSLALIILNNGQIYVKNLSVNRVHTLTYTQGQIKTACAKMFGEVCGLHNGTLETEEKIEVTFYG